MAKTGVLQPQPLTPKEMRVLEFLERYLRTHGVAPTYQEICGNFGFASLNSVQRYLKQLEAKGYLRGPRGNQKRAIALLRPAAFLREAAFDAEVESRPVSTAEVLSLPMLGRVAAGRPIEAYEFDEFIDVPTSFVRRPERTYALRVQGQSMIDDGILDGDVILVQRQAHADDGEIVVAMVDSRDGSQDGATVKRIYKSNSMTAVPKGGKTIELRPANAAMSSMWFKPNEVEIRGVVVGLIRRF